MGFLPPPHTLETRTDLSSGRGVKTGPGEERSKWEAKAARASKLNQGTLHKHWVDGVGRGRHDQKGIGMALARALLPGATWVVEGLLT